MTTENILIGALVLVALAVIVGIFRTKTQGFGKFSTSLVLLTSVLFLSALFFAAGKIEGAVFTNIVFAIAGYAGGLIVPSKDEK